MMFVWVVIFIIAGIVIFLTKRRKIAYIMFALGGAFLVLNLFLAPSSPRVVSKNDSSLVNPAKIGAQVSIGQYTISVLKTFSRRGEQYYDYSNKQLAYTTRVAVADIQITCTLDINQICDQKIEWEIGKGGHYHPLYPDEPMVDLQGGDTINRRITSREIKDATILDGAILRIRTSSGFLNMFSSDAYFVFIQ